MSLSFVSKSIQTTTEDGSFVEKPVEGGTDNDAGDSSSGDHRPLFDQLRSNQERRDAEEEEYQRSMMRGTLALDEEDEAHLISLKRQREREEMELRQRTDQELAAFRAARLDRFSSSTTTGDSTLPHDDDDDNHEPVGELDAKNQFSTAAHRSEKSATASAAASSAAATSKPLLPVIIKKRRKRDSSEAEAKPSAGGTDQVSESDPKKSRADGSGDSTGAGVRSNESNGIDKSNQPLNSSSTSKSEAGGLGGLLAGYDSSSSEEE